MKRIVLKLGNKVIYLHMDEDGSFRCPVCGSHETSLIIAPWLQCPGESIMANHGTGCDCCGTMFGEDDEYGFGETPADVWARLRSVWLRNSIVSDQIITQLYDIGVVIDYEGKQISDINLAGPPPE